MPPLDTSIPLQAKAPEMTNPLQMMLQMGQYKLQQQNSNRLQMDTDSNQAVSQAIQASTGPDGRVDYGNVNSLLKADPRGGFNGQQMQGANLAQQGQQVGIQGGQIANDANAQALAVKRGEAVAKAGVTLLTDPKATGADYIGTLRDLHKNGIIDDKTYINTVDDMTPHLNDVPALQQMAHGMLAKLPESIQAQYVKPVLGAVGTGGGTSFTSSDPLTGKVAVTGSVNNTLAPESAIGRLPTVNAAGQAGSVPISSTVPSSLLPPGMQGGQPQGGAGRYPVAAPGGAQGGAQPGGFIPSQAPPGLNEAAAVVGQGSGKQLLDDSQAAAGSGARVYQLQSALKAIEGAGSIGPGTETANHYKSFLLAQTDLAKYLPGVDPEKIKNYDEANKYLTQYASAKASSLGGGTDSKLATTLSANASTKISDLAAKDVVKANIGLERMGQAQQAAWNASGLPKSEYSTFAAKFGAAMDPRVFVADQLDPAHVKKLYGVMPAKEQEQFRTQYNWAVKSGYITGPQ